jgi:CheY-like chemotaxis protein
MAVDTSVVAVFNTNDDLVELLRVTFEQAGFIVVSGHVDALRRGHMDLSVFLRQHDPKMILYDIAPPYDMHWRFLERIRHSPDMHGQNFVLTSTNAHQVNETVGTREPVYEIVGKPYDLEAITRAVKEASGARPVER